MKTQAKHLLLEGRRGKSFFASCYFFIFIILKVITNWKKIITFVAHKMGSKKIIWLVFISTLFTIPVHLEYTIL